MKFDFIANIKDGRMSDKFRDSINRYILSLKDGPARITIERYRKKRTDPQNRYYWKIVVRIVGQYCGYTDEEAHDALKWKFLRVPAVGVKAGMPDTVRSTASLNTEEFEEYLETVKRWAATELQLYIPDPNEE